MDDPLIKTFFTFMISLLQSSKEQYINILHSMFDLSKITLQTLLTNYQLTQNNNKANPNDDRLNKMFTFLYHNVFIKTNNMKNIHIISYLLNYCQTINIFDKIIITQNGIQIKTKSFIIDIISHMKLSSSGEIWFYSKSIAESSPCFLKKNNRKDVCSLDIDSIFNNLFFIDFIYLFIYTIVNKTSRIVLFILTKFKKRF